uniref:Thioredoxin domain-containing protein n=1 Tax=Spongospora subterranea TaxID=70186 RepID=A0A0H5R987_9EUKA|eukprot:CRZ10690.1 hypothetical protein [Spongospora subterranea]
MQEWRTKGHGYYTEVSDQKQWFEVTKSSERVITHFYRPTTPLCETVDSHLTAIAAKHVETKFVKINAEKSPFLSERLQVVTLPTIIMTTKGTVKDTIVGFEGIAKLDKCSSDDFERRLAMNGMIDYEGDPRQAKDASRRGPMNVIRKSTLAKRSYDGDSSDGESD